MKDPWLLPGPARLVGDVVADLMDGRQVVVRADPAPSGFRAALEDALAGRQHGVRILYDQEHQLPHDLLLRICSDGFSSTAGLPAGIYWVGGVLPQRVESWIEEISSLAESQRNTEPQDRTQAVLMLPQNGSKPDQLEVVERSGEPLSRIDLDVAARYEVASDVPNVGALIAAALAVEMAAPLLPSFASLKALQQWLSAPREALAEPRAISAHAAACGLRVPDSTQATLALWRAQQSVLLTAIDDERLQILRRYRGWWRVPYLHRPANGGPERLVTEKELLELSHLCAQAADSKVPFSHPIRQRLEALREARNALSHLQPLGSLELSPILATSTRSMQSSEREREP